MNELLRFMFFENEYIGVVIVSAFSYLIAMFFLDITMFHSEYDKVSFFVFLSTPEYKLYHLFYILFLPYWLIQFILLGIGLLFIKLSKIFTIRLFKRPKLFKQASDKYDRYLDSL